MHSSAASQIPVFLLSASDDSLSSTLALIEDLSMLNLVWGKGADLFSKLDSGLSRGTWSNNSNHFSETLFASFGQDRSSAEQAYNPSHSISFPVLRLAIGGDRGMIEPARFVARLLADNGSPVYEYRFSYVADYMRSKWTGAPHATEIPFVFDTVKTRYEAATTASDEKTGEAMLSYWVSFAKTGSPIVSGLPTWPAFTAENDTLMDFTADGPVAKPDPSKARLDVTAIYVSSHPAR